MKVFAVVQARNGSVRFPGKVLTKIGNNSLIELLLKRLSKSKLISKIVVATTDNPVDDALEKAVAELGYDVFRGSEKDVLDRYYKAAALYKPDVVVRITGDCPLIDAEVVDDVIVKLLDNDLDNCNNTYPPTFPDGLDVEAFKFSVLAKSWREAIKGYDREHVTPFMHFSGLFNIGSVKSEKDFSHLRWTVDEKADIEVIRNIFKEFDPIIDFSWKKVIELYQQKPDLFMANRTLQRNQGSVLGSGQKLWKRAKTIIPGGNMLLSKRSEMFLPELWPSYFSKAKGCELYDLDDNKFLDMSIMGIGTNTLGYGHPKVDEAVMDVVRKGNMSTLNCPEEVYLAERLIELNPWAEMVRFTRSGGEANAVAVRIARAATGKSNVAICGYHGWHDWYLAANLGSDNLDGHLLPGLEPNGVPEGLHNSVFGFNYNRLDELKTLITEKNIGVIFMEVMRNHEPQNNFLQEVRKLADLHKIVLIFDECTSGFRETYGGLHQKYGIIPDMAMYGKALGNGYAINAVIGKKEIMEAAQKTFISSTFWTERIGPVAALATLEVMKEIKSWEIITEIGKKVNQNWKELANAHNISIDISGLPALTAFSFSGRDSLKYKTYITQEMLKDGILASNTLYACIDHTEERLSRYFNKLNDIFSIISKCESGITDINALLETSVCHSGFKRLN